MKPRKSVQFWFPNLWLLLRRPQHVGASSIAECGLQIADWKGGATDVEFGRVWYDLSVGILALPNPIIVSRRTRMPISTTKIFFGSDRLGSLRMVVVQKSF